MPTRNEVVVVKCVCSTCWGAFRRALRNEVISNFWSAANQNSRAYAEIEESDNTVLICLEPDIGVDLSRAAAMELAQSLATISEVYECFVQLPSRQTLVLTKGINFWRLWQCGLCLRGLFQIGTLESKWLLWLHSLHVIHSCCSLFFLHIMRSCWWIPFWHTALLSRGVLVLRSLISHSKCWSPYLLSNLLWCLCWHVYTADHAYIVHDT